MLKNILYGLLVGFGCVATLGGTIDPKQKDLAHIEYGKKFDCVVKLCGKYEDGSSFCGSAVAINDHFILTAAHVVFNSKTCNVIVDNKEFCITNIVIHKDFEYRQFGIADIAIGYSKEPLNIKAYPELYSDTDEVGKVGGIVGYGFTGDFNIGAIYHDNQKRGGSNYIDYSSQDLLVCSPSLPGDITKTKLEFLIAAGDSGGGLFIDAKLAGINSCVMSVGKKPRSIYGDEGGHTRISKFLGWIHENTTTKK